VRILLFSVRRLIGVRKVRGWVQGESVVEIGMEFVVECDDSVMMMVVNDFVENDASMTPRDVVVVVAVAAGAGIATGIATTLADDAGKIVDDHPPHHPTWPWPYHPEHPYPSSSSHPPLHPRDPWTNPPHPYLANPWPKT